MYGESDGSRERDGGMDRESVTGGSSGRSGERDGGDSSDVCRENTTVVAAAVDREDAHRYAACVKLHCTE